MLEKIKRKWFVKRENYKKKTDDYDTHNNDNASDSFFFNWFISLPIISGLLNQSKADNINTDLTNNTETLNIENSDWKNIPDTVTYNDYSSNFDKDYNYTNLNIESNDYNSSSTYDNYSSSSSSSNDCNSSYDNSSSSSDW